MTPDRHQRPNSLVSPTVDADALPDSVDDYRLLAPIGRGGMGFVYEAIDSSSGRRVAVKLIPREPRSCVPSEARLPREARLAGRVRHPNVVALYDAGVYPGGIYLVMELVTGESVQSLLTHPLSCRIATEMAMAAADGLTAVHACGIIHRDIKPSNLLRTSDGLVKLSDFGIAQPIDPCDMSGTWNKNAGTPHYMSPEQCRHEELDERTDIYSLGATYYTLLTGRTPFADGNAMIVMFAHCSNPIPDARAVRPDVPWACAAIVRKAMAKSRADRFRTAAEMRDALAAALARTP